jgi:hypothetical protein
MATLAQLMMHRGGVGAFALLPGRLGLATRAASRPALGFGATRMVASKAAAAAAASAPSTVMGDVLVDEAFLSNPARWRKKTKQVATLGPASNTFEMVEKLFLAGADVFRLNFSHGLHEEKAEVSDARI